MAQTGCLFHCSSANAKRSCYNSHQGLHKEEWHWLEIDYDHELVRRPDFTPEGGGGSQFGRRYRQDPERSGPLSFAGARRGLQSLHGACRGRRRRHPDQMSKMNRILKIGTDTVTVQAGAIALDVAHELQKHGTAVLCEHRDRQPVGGQRGLRGHEGRFHARRVRPGGLVHHATSRWCCLRANCWR